MRYSHGQQDHLPLAESRLFDGNGSRHHGARLLAILAAGVDLHVHHGRNRRRGTVQWHAEGRQLPASRAAAAGMDHDNSHRGHVGWNSDGIVHQRAAFFIVDFYFSDVFNLLMFF